LFVKFYYWDYSHEQGLQIVSLRSTWLVSQDQTDESLLALHRIGLQGHWIWTH